MTPDSTAPSLRRTFVSRVLTIPDAVLTVSLSCVAALTLLRFIAFFPLAQGEYGYAAWVEDDFFYYAVIAQNLVETGRSTFDGVALTNGYHPLWMMICTGLAAIFDIKSAGFFVTIFLIQSALVMAGVVAFAALARKADEAGLLGRAGQMIGATVYGVVLTVVGANGMEIALLAPLAPMLTLAAWRLCEEPSLRNGLIASGLLCATILSRLDMVVVFAPLGLGVAFHVFRREGLQGIVKLAPAAAALAPLAIYLIINMVVFGDAMPVSGQAKRLMVDGAPFGLSMASISSFANLFNLNDLLSPAGVTLLTLTGAAIVLALGRLRNTIAGTGFLLLVSGVTLFYLQAALTSDWMIWPWYFFPVMLSGAIGAGLLIDATYRLSPAKWLPLTGWVAPILCGALLAFGLKANAWMINNPPSLSNKLFTRALPLAEFARANPGRYAMGDGAGSVGFLLPGDLVQLEGLVNDQAFLDEMQAGGSIYASLKRQGVDYYITSEVPEPLGGCIDLREPKQGGSRVARMNERVCEKPALVSTTGWMTSQIWDVRDGLN